MGKLKYAEEVYVNEQKPGTEDLYVGVEIECFAPCKKARIAQLLIRHEVADYVHLKNDWSIDPDDCPRCHGDGCLECPCDCQNCEATIDCPCEGDFNRPLAFELAILAPQKGYAHIITEVCKILAQVEAKVNTSCGLHVHLDMRSRSAPHCLENLLRVQELLFKLNPKERRTGTYSVPVKKVAGMWWPTVEQAKALGHYAGINASALDKHGTIEVRMHSGSVKASEINCWIDLLIRIVDNKLLKKDLSTLTQLSKAVPVTKTLEKYLVRRQKQVA